MLRILWLSIVLSIFLTSGLTVYSSGTKGSPNPLFAQTDSLEALALYGEANNLLIEHIDRQLGSSSPSKPDIIKAYINIGHNHRIQGQNTESTDAFGNALRYATQINDSTLISAANRELGFNHVISGRYDEGLIAYSAALEIDTEFESWEFVSLNLNAIGKIYEMWRDFDKALEFFYKSLEIAEQHKFENQIAVRLASLASVYKSLGKYEKALDRLDKSLQLEIKLDNEIRKGYRLDQMGEIYTLMEEFALAEEYLSRALSIFRKNNVLASESIVLNHIGFNYLKKKEYESALQYYENSLEIAKRIGFNNMIQKNYEEISLLHKNSGNFEFALNNYKNFIAVRDSAYNERARKQLLDFQVKYESEQKEKELAVLNQIKLEQELEINKSKQQIIIMLGFFIVLLVMIGALLNRFYIKKRAQKQLEVINYRLNELNQTKDKFFSILAHDLKNPIYGFRNISSAIHDNFNDLKKDEITYYTFELKNTSTKLCTFLNELLTWAASQTGRISPKPKIINLKSLLSELGELLAPMAQNKNIQTTISVAEDHVAYADRNMIHTVFRNILTNALKFTPKNGAVSIESYIKDGNAHIKVSDNGIGISEEDIKKLFDIGSDPSKIGNSEEKGSGLGLILTKEFTEKNNGSVEVKSSVGKGSTFIISLPIKEIS